MKQYYESEVLYKLMERDGFNIPSSVPPYESEIKAYLINQVKQAYPKLTDYEAEWLLYNYTKHLPADFPISSVIDVMTAHFENVVPFAYQSAILKGCTLVNLLRTKYLYCNLPTSEEVEMDSSVNIYDANNNRVKQIILNQNLQANKKYLIVLNITQLESGKRIAGLSKTTSNEEVYDIPSFNSVGLKYVKYTPKSDVKQVSFYIDFNNENPSIAKMKQPMIIEYQDGMENWSIPYFEGMQSVKMPVLTTSNEDDTKSNILTVNEDVELRGIGDVQDTLDCLTGELTERVIEIVLDGTEDWTADDARFKLYRDDIINNKWTNGVSNHFIGNRGKLTASNDHDNYFAVNGYGSYLYVRDINLFPNPETQLNEFKTWLNERNIQGNPVILQYMTAKETIKTVDLTTVNEKGETVYFMPLEGTMNVSCSSETIQPTFDMSVPVEATTQNLASFINLEMEE